MTTDIDESVRPDSTEVPPGKITMTAAMREGLDALQREYDAFVETSFETLALITDKRVGS